MHYFEKNVVEIKQEYTIFLINILSPMIYEGIKNIYSSALETDNKFKKIILDDPNGVNPGVLKIFQYYLKNIQTLNNHMIRIEYERIKSKSKCADFFDDLIKAVIKSNIVLLTYNVSEKECKLVNNKYHENVNIELFIHNCYIECARIFFNYPEIFYHEFNNIDIKRNQREALQLIKDGINEAIRKMLPMKLILEEFLKKDYVHDNNDITKNMSDSQYINMRNLLGNKKMLEDDEYQDENYQDENYDNYNGNEDYYDDNIFKKYNEHTRETEPVISKISIIPAVPNTGPNIITHTNNVAVSNIVQDKDNSIAIENKGNPVAMTNIDIGNKSNFTEKIEELILNNDTGTNIDTHTNIDTNMEENITAKQTVNPVKSPVNAMKVLESIKKPKNEFIDMINAYNNKTKVNKENDILSEVNIKIDNKLSHIEPQL